jgi:hypothetical protein
LKAEVLSNTKIEGITNKDYVAGSEGSESDHVTSENKDIEHTKTTNPDVVEEDEDEDYLEDWGAILNIPSNSFSALAQRLTSTTSVWEVEKRVEGSFNYAVLLTNGTTRLVIKVPIVATPDRWQAPQAEIMRSAAHTMQYTKAQLPQFPVPGIISYDASFDN